MVRGARQVGKTHLCETFGRSHFDHVATINFERDPLLGSLFDRPDPRDVLPLLEAHTRVPIQPAKTLLFLDEVQAAPAVLARLRYFAEELPALHVVAAGSLLDFALQDHEFSMPVGRISYLHLEPMTFEEFLLACGEEHMRHLLEGLGPGSEVPAALHQRLLDLLRKYLLCGGMPAVVRTWVDEARFKVCLLDVGLYGALCGLDASTLLGQTDPVLVNGGQLAEQYVGQELRAARPPYMEPALYFWAREQRAANAEVDYVIQHQAEIVPIEVKSGTTGQLRSLHQFLREKQCHLGVRFDAALPSLLRTETTLPDGTRLPFTLLSLPLYLCGQVRRLLSATLAHGE